MEATSGFLRATRLYNPEARNLHNHGCEYLESDIYSTSSFVCNFYKDSESIPDCIHIVWIDWKRVNNELK
jgi:hypothetical protein